jgi:two-component system sensor histidine kinase PilS (NtrC family)
MLVRLGMLALFTALAGAVAIAGDYNPTGRLGIWVWSTLGTGFALTIAYARLLPRVQDLSRFAWTQTALDLVLAAIGVQLSGGIESGLLLLYPMAVLGAATMGGRQQTWASAIAGMALFGTMAALEMTATLEPMSLSGEFRPLPLRDAAVIVARTVAAIVGVALLSSYLAVQLQTTTSQIGNLRALNEDIVRSLGSGLITVDVQGRIRYFNPAARVMLALGDELVGQHLTAVFPDLETPQGRDSVVRSEASHTLPDGRTIHVGLSRMPLRDATGTMVGFIVNFQDVTQLHELAARVRRNERLAALGGMAASVAHEIRNPLAAISGSAELLAMATLGEEDKRLLAIIRRESTRLSNMVSDLLAFTRPRRPEPRVLDAGRSVRETTEAFAADPRNAHIVIDLRAAEGLEVEVDPIGLGQVLWNLLRNGAEAMSGNGELVVEVTATETRVDIALTDHGTGIPADRIETIFDPFFTTKAEGSGFGLAIVHRVVDDNGGSITVQSRVGEGTTFRVSFPRTTAHIDSASSGVLSIE